MAKLGLLSKLGMAVLLGAGSVTATSCTPKEPAVYGPAEASPKDEKKIIPDERKQKRKELYDKVQSKDKTLDYHAYSDVMTNAEKLEVFGTVNPYRDAKDPKISTPITGSLPLHWKFYAEPYLAGKFAIRAEDKPDPMPVVGVKLGIQKERSGFYAGAEYGEMDETETSSAGYLDLKSKATKLKLGAEYDIIQGDKFTLTASAGPTLTLEKNEITGRVGTYDVDDSKKETIVGLEAGLGLEYKFNDRVSLTAGASYGYNFEDDNSNVTSDLTGRVGLKVKF